MAYNWSKEDIYRDLNNLRELAKKETDIFKKNYYLQIIGGVRSILVQDDVLINNKLNRSRKSILQNVLSDYYFYERYYEIIQIFNDFVKKYHNRYMQLSKIVPKIEDNLDVKYYTHDETLELANDFYKSMNDDIYSCFQKIYKDRFHTIEFKEDADELDYYSITGFCIFVDVFKKNYILVMDNSGLGKVNDLIHECGHGISNLIYPQAPVLRPNDFLTEIQSIFFELVFLDKYSNTESYIIDFNKLDYCYDSSIHLLNHRDILKSWEQSNYELDKKFYARLRENNKLTRFDVDNSINVSIDDEGPYIIGFLVALKLFSIYKQDKNSALELLKKIILSQDKDAYAIVFSLIHDFDGVEEELHLIINNTEKNVNKVLINRY